MSEVKTQAPQAQLVQEKAPRRSVRSLLVDNVFTRHYTWRLLMTSSLLTLSSANFAFDNQGFSQTQAMDVFTRRFGEPDPTKPGKYALSASFLAYSNAFPMLLIIVGLAIGSEVSSRFGRRTTAFYMSLWGMICVPIIITSKHRNQFLAARCLNSIYIGMEMSVIPIFQSEIVPREVRGLAVASYQLSFAFGGLVMSGICHRTSMIPNDWSWRIPFLCFLLVPFIVASAIWFQPESPRWLVLKNRPDDARKSLQKFRRAGCDIEHELQQIIDAVHLEQIRIDEVRAESQSGKNVAYRLIRENLACFRPRSNLRRTLIVLAVNFFQQSTGQALAGLYGPVVIKRLGTFSPFNYSLIMTGITGFTYLFNLALNDHVGRRPLLMLSAITQSGCLFTIAGLGTVAHRTPTQDRAMLAVIILFAVSYCAGWGPLSYVVSAETPCQALRDKTARMGFATAIVTQFVVVFCLPYLMDAKYANLNLKVAFIFAPIAFIAFLWVFFFLPECKQLSLEQLDLLFESKVSAPRSAAWGRAHREQSVLVETTSQPTSARNSRAVFVDPDVKDALARRGSGSGSAESGSNSKRTSLFNGTTSSPAQSPNTVGVLDKMPTFASSFDEEKGGA